MRAKEEAKKFLNYIEEMKDEEGFAVVDVSLREGALYNPYSMSENHDLSSDIYEFIDEQTNTIPAEVPLRVRFHGDVPEAEQEQIRKVMKRHYEMRERDIAWDVAANFRKVIILTVFGVLVLAAYFYFSYTSDLFFAEILSIVGSFSLWEAADGFLLERPRLRRERRNLEQNINQRIEFIADPPEGVTTKEALPSKGPIPFKPAPAKDPVNMKGPANTKDPVNAKGPAKDPKKK